PPTWCIEASTRRHTRELVLVSRGTACTFRRCMRPPRALFSAAALLLALACSLNTKCAAALTDLEQGHPAQPRGKRQADERYFHPETFAFHHLVYNVHYVSTQSTRFKSCVVQYCICWNMEAACGESTLSSLKLGTCQTSEAPI
ncbi:hypothetical protein DUNSADRAFT_10940, partial [Dunaliella salina]